MELTPYVESLQRRLAEAGALGGEDAEHLAGQLAGALDSAARLALIDALSAAAGEISAELAPGSVDVRVRGGEPEFVVDMPDPTVRHRDTTTTPDVPSGTPGLDGLDRRSPDTDGDATTRTTLRLPDHIKAQVELAAARDGVSVNTWLVRAATAALAAVTGQPDPTPRDRATGAPNRVTGWVR